jgi:hypothetical protein
MPDVLTIGDDSTLPRIAWESALTGATIAGENGSASAAVEDDGSVDHVADWIPWTFWRPVTAVGTYTITAVLDDTYTINGFAMAGHDATGNVAMDTWDGAAWVEFAAVSAAGDGSCIYLTGDPVATTQLRFRFAAITYLAVLWAGEDVELPEGVGPGWTDPLLALRAVTKPESTRDGVWLGAVVEQWNARLSLDLKNVQDTWARDYWIPFLRTCSTQPFFLHWNNVDWPSSACLCTKAEFGGAAFSGKGFVNLQVAFDADTGLDRRLTVSADIEPLLTEATEDGSLLLE